jgi:hypothetical protein
MRRRDEAEVRGQTGSGGREGQTEAEAATEAEAEAVLSLGLRRRSVMMSDEQWTKLRIDAALEGLRSGGAVSVSAMVRRYCALDVEVLR